MNYASKILAYLSEEDRFTQVLLVAGAPPVEKVGTKFNLVINAVLTPEDIRDTLTFFASNARRPGSSDLGSQGVFAFGMPKMGRFKVHYLTQRGSVFVSIQRITYDIPKLEELIVQPGHLALVEAALNQPKGGIVVFTGPAPAVLTEVVYAAMNRINQSQSVVIYILEQNLSYLLRHRNSVAIQVEVGTDIPSLAEGIQNSLSLAPDLMYVRDPKTQADFAGLMCAAEAGSLVLVSITAFNEQHMLNDLKNRVQDDFLSLCRLVRKTISVNASHGATVSLHELSGLAAAES